MGGGGGPSGEIDEDALDMLDAFSLDQQSLHVFLCLFELALELPVLLLYVLVGLVYFFVLGSQHQDLFFLLFDVAHQVAVRLVGLVEQGSCHFEFICCFL